MDATTQLETLLAGIITTATGADAVRLIKQVSAPTVKSVFADNGFHVSSKRQAVEIVNRLATTHNQCELIR